ncbi:MAG: KdsC family phosphatase [Desulfurella sp.]|uniref:KdsC family phosphatase n=1 Tax=Desulfurella sp. TaxID=1962857 RepID=UPI003D10C244
MIKVIIMDVDGVLTDGRIIIDENGAEYKFFDVKDGHIFHIVQKLGLKIAFISGRYSKVTTQRAKELNVELCIQNQLDKTQALEYIKNYYNVDYSEIAYIGDDIIDIKPMEKCGFSAAPRDAHLKVKMTANYISTKNAGRGAVREIVEEILKINGFKNFWD